MSNFYFFARKKLEKLAIKDRERSYRPLGQTGSVLFIFDGGVNGCEEAIRSLCKHLDHLALDYKGICLDLKRKQKVGDWIHQFPQIERLTRRNLTLLGAPFKKKNPSIQALADRQFGLLLNLTVNSSYAEACLTAASHAKLKVGLKNAENKTLRQAYDICFAYQANPDASLENAFEFPQWTEKIIHYLTHIKANTND
ncbi:MAG: hypothetical protein IKV28_02840 [Bacteroidales bacterium]|nr:hypothetical protein [Bacteroidales bacterium]